MGWWKRNWGKYADWMVRRMTAWIHSPKYNQVQHVHVLKHFRCWVSFKHKTCLWDWKSESYTMLSTLFTPWIFHFSKKGKFHHHDSLTIRFCSPKSKSNRQIKSSHDRKRRRWRRHKNFQNINLVLYQLGRLIPQYTRKSKKSYFSFVVGLLTLKQTW